jgi:nitrite reductase/ring-hydroxylating ferredoxin subunit
VLLTGAYVGGHLSFARGAVVRGPARSPQPRYETRVSGDRIEVRVVT